MGGTIWRGFDFVDPLTADDKSMLWTRDEDPSDVSKESMILVSHCCYPRRLFGGRCKGGWFKMVLRCSEEAHKKWMFDRLSWVDQSNWLQDIRKRFGFNIGWWSLKVKVGWRQGVRRRNMTQRGWWNGTVGWIWAEWLRLTSRRLNGGIGRLEGGKDYFSCRVISWQRGWLGRRCWDRGNG